MARTATIKASSEVDSITNRDKLIDYYKYFCSGDGPKISVIEDIDDKTNELIISADSNNQQDYQTFPIIHRYLTCINLDLLISIYHLNEDSFL